MFGYLFGFNGRISRDKMWLLLIVTVVWLIVIGLAWMIGMGTLLGGLECVEDCAGRAYTSGTESRAMTAFLAGLSLSAAYLVSVLAVYTKRLHDRDKSALWLIPFVLLPLGLEGAKAADLIALRLPLGPVALGADAFDLVVAILAIWGFVELFFFRGTVGPNRFGPDPTD